MVSIIIYTKPETLLHKQGNLENDPDHSEIISEYLERVGRVDGENNMRANLIKRKVRKKISGFTL